MLIPPNPQTPLIKGGTKGGIIRGELKGGYLVFHESRSFALTKERKYADDVFR